MQTKESVDPFEDWIKSEIEIQSKIVLSNVGLCRCALDRLEQRVNDGGWLNDLGELQSWGPILDASVAKLATLKSCQKNHQVYR